MSDDAVVHLESVLGADIMVWKSGRATISRWGDFTHPRSPSARDLAATVGVDA